MLSTIINNLAAISGRNAPDQNPKKVELDEYDFILSEEETLASLMKRSGTEPNDLFLFLNYPIFRMKEEAERFADGTDKSVIPLRDGTSSEERAALRELNIKHIEREGFIVTELKGYDKKPIVLREGTELQTKKGETARFLSAFFISDVTYRKFYSGRGRSSRGNPDYFIYRLGLRIFVERNGKIQTISADYLKRHYRAA